MSDNVKVHLVGGPLDGERVVVPPNRDRYDVYRDPAFDVERLKMGGIPRLLRGEYRADGYHLVAEGFELWKFSGWR